MMYRRVGTLAVSLVVLWAVGCGETVEDEPESVDPPDQNNQSCTVPSGTYTMEFSAAGGNCSQEWVNEISGSQRDFEVDSGEECIRETHTSEETGEDGCTLKRTVKVTGTASGLEDGSANYEVNCPDGRSCEHDFNLYFTKR